MTNEIPWPHLRWEVYPDGDVVGGFCYCDENKDHEEEVDEL